MKKMLKKFIVITLLFTLFSVCIPNSHAKAACNHSTTYLQYFDILTDVHVSYDSAVYYNLFDVIVTETRARTDLFIVVCAQCNATLGDRTVSYTYQRTFKDCACCWGWLL